jgi:hypothetical protein
MYHYACNRADRYRHFGRRSAIRATAVQRVIGTIDDAGFEGNALRVTFVVSSSLK